MYGWPIVVVRLMTPRVTAAMRPMPDDSPSRPSMKLMALIIPTIQKMVKTMPMRPSSWIAPGPIGLLIEPTPMPSETAHTARTSWPPICHLARTWR